jgi:kinesin family protein C2/C3
MCISARANGQSHVPFRNSVLTHLLQDSLSANSKTLMIVHVSPAASDSSETINSLRFAEHARRVELGPAKRNTRTAVGPASPRTK